MKKIASIALAVAASLAMGVALVGCADSAGNDSGSISLGKDFEVANTDTVKYNRNFKTTKTKHTSAVAEVVLPKASGVQPNGDGVVGMIFHLEENEDHSMNFGIIGLRRNKAGKIQYYVSMFENVDTDETKNLNTGVSNFCDLEGVEIGKTGSKAKETGYPDDKIHDLTTAKNDPETVYIVLTADDDGSYDVMFIDSTGYEAVKNADKAETEAEIAAAELEVSKHMLGIPLTIPASVTGDTEATQYKLGMYLNAYPGCTLKGKLTLKDTVNECEIELED